MVIRVMGRAPAEINQYEIICTDKDCRNVIRFDSSDVRTVNRSSMGRIVGSVQGVSCPDCHEVLPVADATELTDD